MASDEEFTALAKLTLQNKFLVDVLIDVVNDFARLIEHSLERCSSLECKDPATVKQIDFRIHMCDYHASTSIMLARSNKTTIDEHEWSVLSRSLLADEKRWVDLANAEQIRLLTKLVFELKKNDESPNSLTECH